MKKQTNFTMKKNVAKPMSLVATGVLAVSLLVLMASCASCTIRTSRTFRAEDSKSKEVSLKVPSFERLNISGNFDVFYRQGDKASVRLVGNERQIEMADVRSDGETLRIGVKKLSLGTFRSYPKIYVTSPDLIEVSLTGNGDFDAEGLVDSDHLSITLTGNGDIDFQDIICDRLDLQLTGNGDIDVKHVVCDVLNLQLTGNGDISVKGRAHKMNRQKAGNGDFDLGNLVVE